MSRALQSNPPAAIDAATRGRILLIDDDDRLRRAYGIMLRRSNYVVDEAGDGKTAEDKLRAASFDLVISDIRLPDKTGLDILRTVRAVDADLPVVLMTGGADLPTAIEAIEAKALRYLLKPVDRDVLCATADDGVRERHKARARRDAYVRYEQIARATHDANDHVGRALTRFEMAYQPIVRYSTREVVAYEALVRPQDPVLGSPDKLFRAAELADRLADVGRAIRASVARTLAAPGAHRAVEPARFRGQRRAKVSLEPPSPGPWGTITIPPAETPALFVNLHPKDLADDALFDASAPLSRYASRVTLEVTERASIEEVPDWQRRIEALRELGFKIALDDLGAGYAGLSAFLELHPDVVKLEMAFARGIAHDTTKQRLVESLAQLCAQTKTMLVIEGIETREQLDAFRELGCDVFQGWLFARPGPAFPAVGW